jgi:type I restriction enzyme M protein
MADEQGETAIPGGFSWQSFMEQDTQSLYNHYSKTLKALATHDGTLGLIFRNARNKIKDPAKLRLLIVELIGQTEWSELSADVKGDAYEGLLEKNAQDTKSGAGQYFTPRPLVEAIVACVRPQPGEVICDPACGTGGFLLAAHDYITKHNPSLLPAQRRHLATKAIRGIELVEEVARLATMNLLLHNIGTSANKIAEMPVLCMDSLRQASPFKADVVLTNPPFGVKGSVTFRQANGRVPDDLTIVRDDFVVTTSNKQLNFVQHVMSMLRAGGRAAIVIPDNVLFESGVAATLRRRLLESFDVHTLLRLPAGLFYAHGVKANVIFFDACLRPPRSRKLWVYDLRQGAKFSVKTNPIKRGDLSHFVECYRRRNLDHHSLLGSHRWQAVSVENVLSDRCCSLDIAPQTSPGGYSRPTGDRLEAIAAAIAEDLQRALGQITKITNASATAVRRKKSGKTQIVAE